MCMFHISLGLLRSLRFAIQIMPSVVGFYGIWDMRVPSESDSGHSGLAVGSWQSKDTRLRIPITTAMSTPSIQVH